MPEANATISTDSEIAVQATQSKMQTENGMKDLKLDANIIRRPDYFVYIFNVSHKTFLVEQAPLIPRMQVPARNWDGERFARVTKLPNVVNQIWQDPDTSQPRVQGFSGENVAMSICNPGNYTLNQDLDFPDSNIMAGANLTKWGVFWSLNETPTDQEIEHNIAKLEVMLRKLLKDGDNLAQNGERKLLTPDHFYAAKYFRYEASWNQTVEVPASCALCGGPMKRGAVVHACSEGVLSVQPGKWRQAVESGLKKIKDVPESERWEAAI